MFSDEEIKQLYNSEKNRIFETPFNAFLYQERLYEGYYIREQLSN